MRRVVILTGPGFQDEEFVYPYYRFLETCEVVVATTTGKDVLGKYGVPARSTTGFKELDPKDFDLVYLPGGFEGPDRVRNEPDAVHFVKQMGSLNRGIAAICHGPWVLVTADLLRGRRATGFQSIKQDLINAGAIYSEEPVVIDGNLVTSPHYRNNPEFMIATLNMLNQLPKFD
jgi:protease I